MIEICLLNILFNLFKTANFFPGLFLAVEWKWKSKTDKLLELKPHPYY